MPRWLRILLLWLMVIFLSGCTSSCGGSIQGYGLEMGTRDGTFQPQGDRASYNATVPYIDLKSPSAQQAAQLRAQSAGGPTLEACKPFHLADELKAGAKPASVMQLDGATISIRDNNGAVIMWLDTGATPSKVSTAMKRLLVNKGFALISSSTTDVANTLNQALGASYVITLPPNRQPYKRAIFHLWGLDGSYTYAVYDANGKEIYDPPGRDVTFEVPQEVVPQAHQIVLRVKGSHAFDMEATC
ncbi:MAG: hypothetical protein RI947_1251 [Candidatus Parcubacteria bacterium]